MSSPLHPVLAKGFIDERQAEVRRQLGRRRDAPPRDHRYRQKLGWLLVEAGLRLAVDAGPGKWLDCPRV